MARVRTEKMPGRYGDGGGLWLQVTPTGTKSWLFRYMRHGREREMGLGAIYTISLGEARDRAQECRKLLLDGLDPIETRKRRHMEARLAEENAVTFRHCADNYIAAHGPSWRNPKHRAQWTSTLKAYAYGPIGQLSVAAIDTGLVLKVLEPIWRDKPETASRVRGRIEADLDWARARGYRTGENPAKWRGHLDKLLPARGKVRSVQHHAALPYADLPAFVADLRRQEGISARALEFTILTAARTGEVIGATWPEIEGNAWGIPAGRMKGARAHRVPLCERACEILQELPRDGAYVFPGGRLGEPLSNMAMLELLKRMNRSDLTVHGFRSTFRDWAAETTSYPRDVVEMALAHSISDKTEAAYRRGDLFAKRGRLMQAWERFVNRPTPIVHNVVTLR